MALQGRILVIIPVFAVTTGFRLSLWRRKRTVEVWTLRTTPPQNQSNKKKEEEVEKTKGLLNIALPKCRMFFSSALLSSNLELFSPPLIFDRLKEGEKRK
ncbi:hypothetical protein AMTR_s00037p00138930 [Amborella trichopoda]|uniref:Transmembrane protein n=1 Tax=Amborella trichopoda TaxID=13333 RepID=U5D4H4_AMBTC|nr:hypothetical protein AMTR_s00037p00138930 [Amborella trichopoda]